MLITASLNGRLAFLVVAPSILGAGCLLEPASEDESAGLQDCDGHEVVVCQTHCLDDMTLEHCWQDGTTSIEDCGELEGYACFPDGGFDPATGQTFGTCSPAVDTCNTCLDGAVLHACWDSGLDQIIDCTVEGGYCESGYCVYPDSEPADPPPDTCNTCVDGWTFHACWDDGSEEWVDCGGLGGWCDAGGCAYPDREREQESRTEPRGRGGPGCKAPRRRIPRRIRRSGNAADGVRSAARRREGFLLTL